MQQVKKGGGFVVILIPLIVVVVVTALVIVGMTTPASTIRQVTPEALITAGADSDCVVFYYWDTEASALSESTQTLCTLEGEEVWLSNETDPAIVGNFLRVLVEVQYNSASIDQAARALRQGKFLEMAWYGSLPTEHNCVLGVKQERVDFGVCSDGQLSSPFYMHFQDPPSSEGVLDSALAVLDNSDRSLNPFEIARLYFE